MLEIFVILKPELGSDPERPDSDPIRKVRSDLQPALRRFQGEIF